MTRFYDYLKYRSKRRALSVETRLFLWNILLRAVPGGGRGEGGIVFFLILGGLLAEPFVRSIR